MAGCGVWKFSFARSLLPLKKVKFDEISPTFAAKSAVRGIEEELALADWLHRQTEIEKFEKV